MVELILSYAPADERHSMASTDDILKAAKELGEQIAEHPAAQRLEGVIKRLEGDREAQRLLADNQRHMTTLMQKEQMGQPIEVEDKRKLEQLQSALAAHPTLGELQMAQMDYLDLMRKVDDAITGEAQPAAGSEAAAAAAAPAGVKSPLIQP